jgi:DNA mismatch repair ATPase MutS
MKNKSKEKIQEQYGKPKNQDFYFDLIDQYAYYKNEKADSTLSEKTLVDLDFYDFFKFIDRTRSSIGQQYLYHKLIQNNNENRELEKQEELIEFYDSNPENRVNSQVVLSKLSKATDYYFPFLIFGKLPEKMGSYWVVTFLQFLLVVCIFLAFQNPFFLIPIVLIFSINLCIHYLHKNRIGNFGLYFSRLNKLASTVKNLIPLCELKPKQKTQIKSDLKHINNITSQILFLKTNDLQQSEMGTYVWFLFELFKIITLGEIVIFNKLVEKIRVSKTEIERLYSFIGERDVAISICSLREGLPYFSKPDFTEENKGLLIEGLYHPLIPDCVSNDIHLENKSLLLTGSNMAGKSTFIKAVNINALSAQVLNTSFTTNYSSPIWKLMTSMTIKDELTENSSYYMEEVYSIGNLLKSSEETERQYLFTIDEIFKGTNTIERISTAKAILEYLNQNNHLVLVSTHDIELTKLLKEGFDLYYFQENIADSTLAFDYKLNKGVLKKSNAIKILELSGYPLSITDEARELAGRLVSEKTGHVGK